MSMSMVLGEVYTWNTLHKNTVYTDISFGNVSRVKRDTGIECKIDSVEERIATLHLCY